MKDQKDCKHLRISQNEICLDCGKGLSKQDIQQLPDNAVFVEEDKNDVYDDYLYNGHSLAK